MRAENYFRHYREIAQMSEQEIGTKFNRDLARAARHMRKRSKAADQFTQMHKRQALTVRAVLRSQLERNLDLIADGHLEPSSMLAVLFAQGSLKPTWHEYCDRIQRLLEEGIQTACATHRPHDEPHLQQLCDSCLRGHDLDLVREFPFMRWSLSSTKPDWSSENVPLWIELKYVRSKSDIKRVIKDIAEDITKYGDNNLYVLFVVYDPDAHIKAGDKRTFAGDILRHETMRVHFIH